MDLNVASLIAALAALGLSSWLALRQALIMRHANEVPLLMETYREYRSPFFQQQEHYIVKELAGSSSRDLAVSELSDEARIAATSLIAFFNAMGGALIFGMIDEPLIVTLFGYRANNAWISLEPHIQRERQRRDDDTFASFFEDVVCRFRDHKPPIQTYRLKIRRLPTEGPRT